MGNDGRNGERAVNDSAADDGAKGNAAERESTANDAPASDAAALRARKKELRRAFGAERAALDPTVRARADAALADRLAQLPAFASAQVVLTYVSIGDEVDTRELIAQALVAGKTVAAPRVSGPHVMDWYRIDGVDGLVRSSFGVLEPPADEARRIAPDQVEDALALVPGFAFTPQGYRLGYGGGFYDVFLAGFRGATVGLCRDEFLRADVGPLEAHDQAVDLVVTPTRTIRCAEER